jgi:membrane-associated phospholipid phosphatase
MQAFSRVYVGVHFPFDVLSGAVIGVIMALCVKRIMKILDKWINLVLGLARKLYLA